VIGWLRRLDPGWRAMRRAARVTLVACIGFYTCRYGLDDRTMATYALFGAVALGGLSQIPGAPAQQARTLLSVLPVVWVLVTLGTLFAVHDWLAAAGMFVLGFAVSFAGVGGPRLVSVVNGLQLLYILPCFPPYAPHTLGVRLIGVTIATVLLAAAAVVVWPDPAPVPYQAVLARAVSTVADCLGPAADGVGGDPGAADRLAAALPVATEAADALRPSRLQPAQRPASASRLDHALAQAGGVVRYSVSRAGDLLAAESSDQLPAPAAAALLSQARDCTAAAAACLRGEAGPPDAAPLTAALARFRQARQETDPTGVHPDRLRLGALAVGIADGIKVLVNAVRVTAGAPVAVDPELPDALWYANEPSWRLWWGRLRMHFTPRSVYFQGALRLALALAVARFLAGAFDLSHGFWVLLAILTLLRTSAAQTRMASWPILVGTVIGAVLAGGLLVLVAEDRVYAIVLPFLMFVGFTIGPVAGQLWGQAAFTLVVAVIFAQLAPTNWRLAEARIIDVTIGLGIGVLTGLLAWPRGGTGEMHRATARFFGDCSDVVRDTVASLTRGAPVTNAVPRTQSHLALAEASYSLWQSERRGPTASTVDWQAAMVAGHHATRGAGTLLRSCPPGRLIDCVRPLATLSGRVAHAYTLASTQLLDRDPVSTPAPPDAEPDWPTDLGPELYNLADLRIWLDGLTDDLRAFAHPTGAPVNHPTLHA
jgi:uncharacterized membrane protein YccC